MHTMFNIQPI